MRFMSADSFVDFLLKNIVENKENKINRFWKFFLVRQNQFSPTTNIENVS